MSQYTGNRRLPAGGPIANIIVVVVGALIIGATIILGVFAFIALAAIILISAAVLGIRVWWLDRKKQRSGEARHSDSGGNAIIEGEYRVVAESRDKPRQDRRIVKPPKTP
ncbi:MAG: hypothetical protein ACE5OQ_10250 [Woeseia sp.]